MAVQSLAGLGACVSRGEGSSNVPTQSECQTGIFLDIKGVRLIISNCRLFLISTRRFVLF